MRIHLSLMDPNWSADSGGGGRGANNHYHLNGPIDIAHAVRTSGMWSDSGLALVWRTGMTRDEAWSALDLAMSMSKTKEEGQEP